MKSILGVVGASVATLIFCVLLLGKASEQPYTVYATGNDGRTYAITYYPLEVKAVTAREVLVEYNDNIYSCHYTGTAGVAKGETVWCGMVNYGENNIAFVSYLPNTEKN